MRVQAAIGCEYKQNTAIMAGRDTPMEPEAGGRLTLAEIATMGMPIEWILEQLVQEPNADHAGDIINLGQGSNRAFRDRLRYAFSRRNSPLLRHLSADEIRQLSSVMGDAVAANLARYTAQFPTRYNDLFHYYLLDTTVLRELLGQTDLLQHNYYRDMIWSVMPVHNAREMDFRDLYSDGAAHEDTNVDLFRLMHRVGVPMDGVLETAVVFWDEVPRGWGLSNALRIARYAIEELGQTVTYGMIRESLRETHLDMLQLLAEHAGEDIDRTIRDALRCILKWRGQPEREVHTQWIIALIISFITEQRYFMRATTQGKADVSRLRQNRMAKTLRELEEYILLHDG